MILISSWNLTFVVMLPSDLVNNFLLKRNEKRSWKVHCNKYNLDDNLKKLNAFCVVIVYIVIPSLFYAQCVRKFCLLVWKVIDIVMLIYWINYFKLCSHNAVHWLRTQILKCTSHNFNNNLFLFYPINILYEFTKAIEETNTETLKKIFSTINALG